MKSLASALLLVGILAAAPAVHGQRAAVVRQHTVVVHIVPGSNSYSVKYADSSNMKYAVEYGQPVIHPFYNDWVDQLIKAIDFELEKL